MATDKIVAEYTVKVDEALKNLDKLAGKVDKIDAERKKSQAGFKDMSSSLASSFSKVGAAIGLAFGTAQIISFGKEAVKLAARAEGIETAFRKLNNPRLLDDLRRATRGTVTDLQLMQSAVRAQNFKVPLEQLASYFKFATNRAIETGESVDYLVNSIIDGIGRKSTLVLDNLGISATELQEEMKKTGDFGAAAGNIIARELEKAGDVADTTATKLARLSTIAENAQTSVGEALINLGTGFAFLLGLTEDLDSTMTGNEKAAKNLAKAFGDDVAGAVDIMIKKNAELLQSQLKVEELKEKRSYQNSLKAIEAINEEIEAQEERQAFLRIYIKELKAVYDASVPVDEVTKEQIRNLALLNAEIKRVTDARLDENVSIAETKKLNVELIALERERAILLGQIRGSMTGEQFESIASFHITEIEAQQQATDDIIADYAHRNGEIEASMVKRNAMLAIYNEEQKQREIDIALELAELRRQENREFFETTLAAWQSLTNTVATLVEAQYQRQYNALDQSLKKEQITREQYDKRKSQLGREQAKKQKEFAIVQAVINTALGVTNAFATAPNIILGAVLAAVVAAAGAAEIATISSQPLPQFAEGGWVDSKGLIHGRSHRQGGVKIEAEGNEYITKGKYAKPNAEILEAINTGNWERYKMENIITPAIEQVLSGGMENMGASYMLQNQFNDRNILRGLDRNRTSEKNGFIYLGDRIERALLSKGNDRYA
jgi:iron-sulfur cluster repair protein YtfE (RIC family)